MPKVRVRQVAVKAKRSSFGVLILAAGASRRMGESKILLPWGGRTILGHLVDEWRSLEVGQVAVVIRAGDEKLEAELGRLGFVKGDWIENKRTDEGMFSSIEAAAGWGGWRTWVTHFVIALADQPQIRGGTLQALMEFAEAKIPVDPKVICQPTFRAHPKHPVIIAKILLQDWIRFGGTEVASGVRTLRDFLSEHQARRRYLEVEDDGLAVDLDTPEDYRSAAERFLRSLQTCAFY